MYPTTSGRWPTAWPSSATSLGGAAVGRVRRRRETAVDAARVDACGPLVHHPPHPPPCSRQGGRVSRRQLVLVLQCLRGCLPRRLGALQAAAAAARHRPRGAASGTPPVVAVVEPEGRGDETGQWDGEEQSHLWVHSDVSKRMDGRRSQTTNDKNGVGAEAATGHLPLLSPLPSSGLPSRVCPDGDPPGQTSPFPSRRYSGRHGRGAAPTPRAHWGLTAWRRTAQRPPLPNAHPTACTPRLHPPPPPTAAVLS